MTQQNIGVGNAPNDGLGDPLRTAFQKVNANFTEVYSGAFSKITVTQTDTLTPAVYISGSPALDNNLQALVYIDSVSFSTQAGEAALYIHPRFGDHAGVSGEKAGLWVQGENTDNQTTSGAVAAQFKMFSGIPGQMNLSTWGIVSEVNQQTGTDGFCVCAELGMFNSGVDQPLSGAPNSKYIIKAIADKGLTTAGLHLSQGGHGGTMQYGIVCGGNAIAATGQFLNYDDKFIINQNATLNIDAAPNIGGNESVVSITGQTSNNQAFESFLGIYPTFLSSATVGEKAALWVQCGNTDENTDIVGGQFKMFSGAPGQTHLSTWATVHEVSVQTGTDAFAVCAEMSMLNDGVDQPLTGQANSKYVQKLIASNGLVSAGIHYSSAAGGTFQYAIVGDPAAVEATGYFIDFGSNFRVSQPGILSIATVNATSLNAILDVVASHKVINLANVTGSNGLYVGNFVAQGYDASDNSTVWGEFDVKIVNAAAGSRSSQGEIWASVANSEVLIAYFGSSIGLNYKTTMAASTTAAATLNIPVGPAPTSPLDGDIWREDNTNTGLKIRVNGVTKTITLS